MYGCKSNYATGDTVTVFRFPKDEQQRTRWVSALPNANFVWTKDAVICAKHWPDGFESKKVQGGNVQPTDAPTVFENVPPSCLPPAQPKLRSAENTLDIRNAEPDELPLFLERDKFSIDKFIDAIGDNGKDFVCHRTSGELCLQSGSREGSLHEFSLYISSSSHEFEAYHRGVALKVPFMRSAVITSMSEVDEIINFLRYFDSDSKQANFCRRQLALLSNKKYSSEDYAVAIELRSHGTASYTALRNYITIPSLRTLRRLVSSVNTEGEKRCNRNRNRKPYSKP